MLSSSQIFQENQNQLDHSRLLSLINSLSEGFLAVAEDGTIELSNSVALSLLDTNALTGKNISQSMPITDTAGRVWNVLDLAKSAGPSLTSSDYKLKYTDGTTINLYLNISTVKTAFGGTDKVGYVILFRDVTREKIAQEERDEFISVASHELRNPVAIAEGSISNAILLAEKSQLPGNIQAVLKSAHEQIIFLGTMINDLAMISRADREKFTKIAEEFNPSEVIASLQNDYLAQAQKKGLEIKADAANLPKIHGSKLYTREILQNFLSNAIKYTEHGGIYIKGTVSGDGIDLSVADTGIGVRGEEQNRLFTKFFRSEDSRVRQINGTGLGLYVSAKLAKLMGCRISMSSQYNKGSVFTLHVPKNFAEPAQENSVAKTVA